MAEAAGGEWGAPPKAAAEAAVILALVIVTITPETVKMVMPAVLEVMAREVETTAKRVRILVQAARAAMPL